MELPLWEQLDELDEYRQLGRVRTDHVVRVREPMVLVSQIQRSGGTLLSRLFDGHPECHAHPYELKIGHKARWPKLDLTALLHDAAHNPTKRPVVDNAALDAVDVVAESGDFISPQEQAARLLRRPIGGDVLVAPAALSLAVGSQLHAAIVAQAADDSR